MAWTGISSQDKTSLRFVKPDVKISADCYFNNTMKQFLSGNVLRLLRNSEKTKTIFHQDNTPRHVSKKPIPFLNGSKLIMLKLKNGCPSHQMQLQCTIQSGGI